MTQAHINQIGTARPPHDIHAAFQNFTARGLSSERHRALFQRMARRAGISHRYSVLHEDGLVEAHSPQPGFYRRGLFPGTARRMKTYADHAPDLAEQAVRRLDLQGRVGDITHLIVASCTGFVAPGLDQLLAARLGLRADLQRTMVGFMGCAAAVPALRLAQAAILADPKARVLVVNLELCTLHMQETDELETALTFLLFGDGATAALVTAEPHGLALEDFRTMTIPDSEDCITWHVGDHGFLMHLSGRVPSRIAVALRAHPEVILRGEGTQALQLWAVHGGGRSVLDAVEHAFGLEASALAPSRAVLDAHGNMSSATVMFVLANMLRTAQPGQRGLAIAFGPGMVTETFRFMAR